MIDDRDKLMEFVVPAGQDFRSNDGMFGMDILNGYASRVKVLIYRVPSDREVLVRKALAACGLKGTDSVDKLLAKLSDDQLRELVSPKVDELRTRVEELESEIDHINMQKMEGWSDDY